jgi:hypothetical protein
MTDSRYRPTRDDIFLAAVAGVLAVMCVAAWIL